MRKLKALSVITSVAMAGSMIVGAIPFTASADAVNPLGYQLTTDKTTFTTDELAGGKTVTVYVDPVGTVTEADKVGSVEFKIKSDAWGKVDPVDLILSDDNAIGTGYGNHLKADKPYNQAGSMVVSKWDGGDKPTKAGYGIQDYSSVSTFTGYSDDYCPAVLIMSDSSCGFMRTDASYGKHIAEFHVKLPADLAAGSYNLSITDAKSMIVVDGKFGSDNSVLVNAPTAKGLTFTVTGSSSESGNTDTPIEGDPLEGKRIYDGDAYITIGEEKAAVGDTINVPVYLKLDEKIKDQFITGIAFKTIYDNTALELVRIVEPDESGLSEGGFNQNPKTGVFLYNFTVADITVDSTKPICYLQFKVKDGAKDGSYAIDVINHLFGATAKLQIVHTQQPLQDATYLTPHVTKGAVIVGEGSSDHLIGDANQDGKVNVRDAAYIAKALATGTVDKLPCSICADYNQDGKVNVRDAAAIAKMLATKK
jgi:hypothetical protein